MEMVTFGKNTSVRYKGMLQMHILCAVTLTFEMNSTHAGKVLLVNQFCDYVKKMHEERDDAYETEYAVSRTQSSNTIFT